MCFFSNVVFVIRYYEYSKVFYFFNIFVKYLLVYFKYIYILKFNILNIWVSVILFKMYFYY